MVETAHDVPLSLVRTGGNVALITLRLTLQRRQTMAVDTPSGTGQVAATLASRMGIDWASDHPNAGLPIR